jgi:hypothetical protein
VSSSNLIRLSGLAAIVAGALLLVGDLLSLATESENRSEAATTAPFVFTFLLYLIGTVLLLVGLVGLYIRQSEASGILGLVGFAAAFLGEALVLGAVWTELFVAPFLANAAPAVLDAGPTGTLAVGFILTFALGALGWLLFGLAALRARVYPRAAAIALMVGAVISFLPIPASGIVLDAVVAWLGFILLTGTGAVDSDERPARVR